jgi:hypothetical protein
MFILLQKIQARIETIYIYLSISRTEIVTSIIGNEFRDCGIDFVAALRVSYLSILGSVCS